MTHDATFAEAVSVMRMPRVFYGRYRQTNVTEIHLTMHQKILENVS